MKNLTNTLTRHQTKVWMLATFLLAVLLVNMAAAPAIAPGQWEYKTVVFKVEEGESVGRAQQVFEGVLNREATGGWEFVGPCARLSGSGFGIEYLVLRRRVR